MATTLEYNNIKKYFDKFDKFDVNNAKGGEFIKKLINDYNYLIPQIYLKQHNDIKTYHNITLQLELFTTKYEQLKKILELNSKTLKIPTNNLNLDLGKNNNIIYKDLGKKKIKIDILKINTNISTSSLIDTSNVNHLLQESKQILKNFKEYRSIKNIYSHINEKIFIKILNDNLHKEKTIFIKIYKNFGKHLNHILKYKYSTGILGYGPIFNIGTINNKKNNINTNTNNNNNKYVLIKYENENENVSENVNETGSDNKTVKINNSTRMTRLDNALTDYTELYNSYDYSKFIIEIKTKLEEHCKQFHDISLSLSQKSYTNIYELLNLLLDQEYHLINFMLHFRHMSSYETLLKQDVKIRKYIKRNLLNFNSYMDDYSKIIPSSSKNQNLFEIESYSINDFFKKK